MKKVLKFVAECGGNDSYFSCGHSGPSWDLDLSPETLHRYEANYKKRVKLYEKLVQKENRKIKQTYEYAMKKVLPECIKQLKTIKDKNVNLLVDELNNIDVDSRKLTIIPVKKAVNLAWRHNKEKLGDKFLKIMIAIEEYRDAIKHFKAK